ncbi:M4 family metallopeptidase [Flavobacterium sp. FlaQc-52]|jgi:bacillolysin|uniref:M4 family metallopeptidase n=1 Tax=Flavobacterium sp. FlaQc-52 TaxID=3374185 RepID=UPI003757DCB1
MKRILSKIVTVTVVAFSLSGVAQEKDKRISQKSLSGNGVPSLITFSKMSTYKSADAEKVFKEQLALRDNQSFAKVKSESDREGFTHDKFQLYEQGIKVEFANYSLHSKKGRLESMNGEFYKIVNARIKPTLSAQEAFNKAVAHTGAKTYLWDSPKDAAAMNYEKPKGELVFLPDMENQGKERTTDKVRLAYKFDIYATNPLSRGDLYIDAATGQALFYNATIKHLGEYSHGKSKAAVKDYSSNSKTTMVFGNAATRYNAAQTIETTLSEFSYILLDGTRGNGIQTYNSSRTAAYPETDFTDADNNWTAAEYANANKDDGALDAHWGAEKTYDYWSAVHGRNSYDNAGAKIKSYVHYNLIAAGYPDNNNAYWNGTVMTYGDGSGAGGFDILTSLDVAGHEIGHAVCEHTANLAYQKESGAMNEGFSDIWGACIEYHTTPVKSTWLIGEDIEKRDGHLALRSMSDPKSERQPDTYKGTNWVSVNCFSPQRSNDFCGVHTNSGVLNHWFYILSIGKSGTNDIGSAYDVVGITIEKAEKIAYRLESVYLTANATFANARTFGIQSAIDLYGANSAEVIATTNAFYAVGVGEAYVDLRDTAPPTAPASLAASGITETTANLTWTASTDNVAVTGYDVYEGTTLKGTTTATNYKVIGLTAQTAYRFSVKAKDAAGNVSAESNVIDVIATEGYCVSKGESAEAERIGKVVFGTISNTSTGTAGYEKFTEISTNVRQGAYCSITITPSWTSRLNTNKEGYAVFIDYNQDGDFSDAGETVWTKSISKMSFIQASFRIPATATLGITRLRVSMKYNGIPTACESFSNGQVEDYSVNIIDSGSFFINELVGEVNAPGSEFDLYPNPTDKELNVTSIAKSGATFKITNALGQKVDSGQLSNNPIDVSKLNAGIYTIEFNSGQKRVTKKFIKK